MLVWKVIDKNGPHQRSRFRALSELDLNLNVGEEEMDEDLLNPNDENISVNGDHKKGNLPKEIM